MSPTKMIVLAIAVMLLVGGVAYVLMTFDFSSLDKPITDIVDPVCQPDFEKKRYPPLVMYQCKSDSEDVVFWHEDELYLQFDWNDGYSLGVYTFPYGGNKDYWVQYRAGYGGPWVNIYKNTMTDKEFNERRYEDMDWQAKVMREAMQEYKAQIKIDSQSWEFGLCMLDYLYRG